MSTESKNQKPSANNGVTEEKTIKTPEELLADKEAELQSAIQAKGILESRLKELEDAETLRLNQEAELQSAIQAKTSSIPVYDPNEKMFGNKDDKKEHSFPKSWENGVVVMHAELLKGSTGVVIDPSTKRLAVYHPDVYEAQVKNEAFKGIKTVLVHDPRTESIN